MKRILLSFSCLVIFVSPSYAVSEAKQSIQEQTTLEGTLKEHPKWLFKYLIKLGSGQEIALRDLHDALKEIIPGSFIKVQGCLATTYHSGGTKDNPSPFSAQWVVYMDVKKVEVLKPYGENIHPDTTFEDWSYRIPTLQLDVVYFAPAGDIGGKYISEIIKQKDITEVVVLKNVTSAVASMHIGTIGGLLRENPKIESLFETDPNTGNRKRLDTFHGGFFIALLRTKNGEYVGFELDRNKARIFTKDGDGVVAR